jgi:hypothetical protein
MLTRVYLEEKRIVLKFDPKNKGKYRLKKLKMDKIASTYSEAVKKKNIGNSEWYLEWQISYYIEKSTKDKVRIPKGLYINKLIKLSDGKEVYPFELPVLFCHALRRSLLPNTSVKELIEWISNIKDNEFLDNLLKPNIRKLCENMTIKGMKFIPAQVRLPFMVYENPDGTWVEIIWQKQQYAYSFQPMVYFCIPYNAFSEDYKWIIDSSNTETIVNLLKIFALTSGRHRSDILQILRNLTIA